MTLVAAQTPSWPSTAKGASDGASGTSSAQVHQKLVALIADGTLRPGDPLGEAGLAARFGCSRTPVREALQSLAHDGLAERGARRAFVVRALDVGALDDAFEALAEIEALTAALAVRRMTAVERQALEGFVAEGAARAAAGDGAGYGRINVAFHDALIAGAHNRTLAEMTGAVRLRLAAYRNEQFVRADRLASSQAEHEDILAALLRGDEAEVAHLMRRHIAATALTVRRMMGA